MKFPSHPKAFLFLASAAATLAHAGTPPVGDDPSIPNVFYAGQPHSLTFHASDVDGDLKECQFYWKDYRITSGNPWTPIGSRVPLAGGDDTVSISWVPDPSLVDQVEIHVGVWDLEGNNHGTPDPIVNWPHAAAIFMPQTSFDPPANPVSIVGTLAGDVSVDNKGAANYSIPLEVPPGRGGVQPSLSVNYSSQGGNGVMGVGFSLSAGQSSITRGRSLLARHGEVKGITFGDSDQLYLDGKLLIKVGGTHWSAGAQYRTEVDSFVKITAHGDAGGSDDPLYFKVESKDGTVSYYGRYGDLDGFQMLGGETTGRAFAYALVKVEDLQGNDITYDYAETASGSGEYVLQSIEYTGNDNGGVSPFAEVRFLYNTQVVSGDEGGDSLRDDIRKGYLAGRKTRTAYRLDAVVVSIDDGTGSFEAVRRYDFGYEYAAVSGVTRLKKVECFAKAGLGTSWNSMKPTTFDWSDADVICNSSRKVNVNDGAPLPTESGDPHWRHWTFRKFTFADVDGDGLADYLDADSDRVVVYLATGDGEFEKQTNNWLSGVDISGIRVAELNGDGMADLVIESGASYDGPVSEIYAVVSNGTSFVGLGDSTTPTLVCSPFDYYDDPLSEQSALEYLYESEKSGTAARISVADYTGDGRDDILLHPYSGNLWIFESEGDGFKAARQAGSGGTKMKADYYFQFGNGPNQPPTINEVNVFPYYTVSPTPTDLDGDGRMDYVYTEFWPGYYMYEPPSSGGYGVRVSSSPGSSGTPQYEGQRFVIARLMQDDGHFGPAHLIGSSPSISHAYQDPIPYDAAVYANVMGDYNGDGATDFLIYDGYSWRMHLSKGQVGGGIAFHYKSSVFAKYVELDGVQNVPTTYFPVKKAGFVNVSFPEQEGNRTIFNRYMSTVSGENMFAIDVNKDGLSDYVWAVRETTDDVTLADCDGWWVMYSKGRFDSDGSFFEKPVRLEGEQWDIDLVRKVNYYTYGGYESLLISGGNDFDGDGVNDWVLHQTVEGSKPKLKGFHFGEGEKGDLVKQVANGLGQQTEIAYKPLTDSSVYVKGSGSNYPIREDINSRHVVSDVWKDYGGDFDGADGIVGTADDDSHRFNYVYSGARTDLAGRGFLGFHSFVTLDTETDLFSYQFLTQSFPMTGLVKREQTLRRINGNSLRQLGWTDNTVVFDEVESETGSQQYGTLFPMVTQSSARKWEDSNESNVTADPNDGEAVWDLSAPSGAYVTVDTEVLFDKQTTVATALPPGYVAFDDVVHGKKSKAETDALLTHFSNPNITRGNVVQTVVDYGGGMKDTTVNTYHGPDYVTGKYVGGLLATTQTTSETPVNGGTSGDYDVVGPTTSYTYHQSGPEAGKVDIETVAVADDSETTDIDESDLGTKTTYTYHQTGAAAGQLQKVTLASVADASSDYHFDDRDTQTITAYDSTGRFPITAKNAYGHASETRYDDWGRPVRSWDVNRPEAKAVVTEYDALGRITKVTDPLLAQDIVTTTTYEAYTGMQVGTPTEAEDRGAPKNTLTSAYRSVTSSTKQPSVTTYFDRLGQPIRVQKEGYGGQESTTATTDTLYDSDGRVVAVTNAHTSGSNKNWTFTDYDALGRVKEVLAPAFGSKTTAGSGVESATTRTTYEYHGRLTQVTVTDETTSKVQKTTTQTNAKGETVAVWNADNHENNEVTSLDDEYGGFDLYSATPTATPSVVYDLDAAGRMRQTRLRGNADALDDDLSVLVTYDPLGNQTLLKDPDKGEWKYRYDALGQLLWQQNAKGDVTVQTYDPLGRMLTRSVTESGPGATETTDWYYWDESTDAAKHTVEKPSSGGVVGPLQRSKHVSLQASGQDYIHQVAYHYNVLGQLVYDLHSVDGKLYYFYSDYDDYGRMHRRTYFWRPDGLEDDYTDQVQLWNRYGLEYSYDGSYSYVETVKDSQGRTWWEANGTGAYDYLDRPVEYRKGLAHVTTRSYDAATGLLSGIQTGTGGAVQNLGYQWDGMGNLDTRTSGSLSETFAYDELNRLTHRQLGSGSSNEIATYDNIGNILKKIEVGGAAVHRDGVSGTSLTTGSDYEYSAGKPHAVHKAGGWTINYDANGNMSERYKGASTARTDEWTYKWTSFDKPRWMDNGSKGSEFHYDASRQRAVHYKYDRTGSTRDYTSKKVYVGGNMEIDFTDRGADASAPDWALQAVRIYIDGPDGRSGAYEYRPRETDQSRRHDALVYHQDHLGSIQAITRYGDATGNYALDDSGEPSVFSYGPWGERRNPDTWDGKPIGSGDDATSGADGLETLTPRGFTDHEMLDDLGLVHMNGRIYDPLLGRFLSADPLIQAPDNLQSYNRYSYVFNNPLRFFDPDGEQARSANVNNRTQARNMMRAEQNRLERATRDMLEAEARGDRIEATRIKDTRVNPSRMRLGLPLWGTSSGSSFGGYSEISSNRPRTILEQLQQQFRISERARAQRVNDAVARGRPLNEEDSVYLAFNPVGTTSSNARRLRANMIRSGRVPIENTQSAHIVPSTMRQGARGLFATGSRSVLHRNGVELNESANGAFLNGRTHNLTHTERFQRALYTDLKGIESRGLRQGLSREDIGKQIREYLERIAKRLEELQSKRDNQSNNG